METPAPIAIILSAGMSSRIGNFKPLLSLGGELFLERVIALYRSAGIQDIRAVADLVGRMATALNGAGCRLDMERMVSIGPGS